MEREHWYHDFRDRKGRFAKVETIDWNKEKSAMTIENETGEQVTMTEATPTSVTVVGEETVIRSNMNRVADWLVQFSSFSQKITEMETKMNGLTTALENAEQRVAEANKDRQAAVESAAKAVADAVMAKEAYTVVAKERAALSTELQTANATIVDIGAQIDLAASENSKLRGEVADATRLFQIACEERDRLRDENEGHTTRIGEHVSRIADLEREASGHHFKLIGLEDEVKRLSEELGLARLKVTNIKQMLQ